MPRARNLPWRTIDDGVPNRFQRTRAFPARRLRKPAGHWSARSSRPAVVVGETLGIVDLGDGKRGGGQQNHAEGGDKRGSPEYLDLISLPF